jgi:hypothetical protein
MKTLPATPAIEAEQPGALIVGDDDEVRLEHAIAMYRSLPDAELG